MSTEEVPDAEVVVAVEALGVVKDVVGKVQDGLLEMIENKDETDRHRLEAATEVLDRIRVVRDELT